jgi:hypothetical protein
MNKIDISAVGHQNLSHIFNLCNVEGNIRPHHRRIARYPKKSLTLTLGRTREREREVKEGGYPGPLRGRRRRGSPAEEGAPAAGGEARDGGGGGFKGEELEQEIGVGRNVRNPHPPRPNEMGPKTPRPAIAGVTG